MKPTLRSLWYVLAVATALLWLSAASRSQLLSVEDSRATLKETHAVPSESPYTNDSIVADLIRLLSPEGTLSQEETERLDGRVGSFPGKIIRRDTATYYMQTALRLAYYEFMLGDTLEAKKVAREFSDNVAEREKRYLGFPYKYSIFKTTPSRIRSAFEARENNLFSSLGSSPRDLDQEIALFLVDLMSDIPMDLDLDSYKKLLVHFKLHHGSPAMFDRFYSYDFFERCEEVGRDDILKFKTELWPPEDARVKLEEMILDAPDEEMKEKAQVDFKQALKELELLFYPDRNIAFVDSLISVNAMDSIGKYISNFQFSKLSRGELRELISISEKYKDHIAGVYRVNFYNLLGLAYLYLDEAEKALECFEKALEVCEGYELTQAVIRMNIAWILAENGLYDEVAEIFSSIEPYFTSHYRRFEYLDAKGNAYSKFNPALALKCYEEADSLLNLDPTLGLKPMEPLILGKRMVRHFARETKLVDHDLYKWRKALRMAREHAGSSLFYDDFTVSSDNGFYFSETGRFKNYLFDFEGAREDFDKVYKGYAALDSADYRFRYLYDCVDEIFKWAEPDGKEEGEIVGLLESESISPLHKIWLLFDLAVLYSQTPDTTGPDKLRVINHNLRRNLGESLLALSTLESRHLIIPVNVIQEILMGNLDISENINELINLNLLRKGLMQSSKTALEKKLAQAGGPISSKYADLVSLRGQLNFAYSYEDSLKVRKLLPEIMNREGELYASIKDSIDIEDFIGYDVELVKSKLKKDDIAIDFIEHKNNGTVRTGAFLIFHDSSPIYVDITDSVGNPDSTAVDMSRLWLPLMPYLENKEDIYFAADGRLLNLGIEFYPDSDGIPVIYNRKIHRLSHLRNIDSREDTLDGEFVVIGVSDHNSPVGSKGTAYRGNWVDLEMVDYEMELIGNSIKGLPHTILRNDEAVEENVKQLDKEGISVLHISTHGVSLNKDDLLAAATSPSDFNHFVALRTLKSDRNEICALILRRGNLSWKMPHILDDEDDILTAEEIEVMNFPNLRLTVLSSCNSGKGSVDSDGLWGLVRAFKIAGSRNIICSLNPVEDYWTSQFMALFYEKLASGLPIYESFRTTQMELYETAPHNREVWASFILIE